MYIKTLRYLNSSFILSKQFLNVTSLIIYAPKTLPICHHVVNKSAQGEEADFEINGVILRQS